MNLKKKSTVGPFIFRPDLYVFPLLYSGIGINMIVTMSSIYLMQPTEIYMQLITVGRPGLKICYNLNKQILSYFC